MEVIKMPDNILNFKIPNQHGIKKQLTHPLKEAVVYYNHFNNTFPHPYPKVHSSKLLEAYSDILSYQLGLLEVSYALFYKPFTFGFK